MDTKRAVLIATLKRRHNIGRMIEVFSVMVVTLGAGAVIGYLTAIHHWDDKGRSLALTGMVCGVLAVWFIGRKVFATLPIHPYEHDFEALADELLGTPPNTSAGTPEPYSLRG